MVVRFGTWNKEKMLSQYIIICSTWVFGITILFPFYQVDYGQWDIFAITLTSFRLATSRAYSHSSSTLAVTSLQG